MMQIKERMLRQMIAEQGGRVIKLEGKTHWKARCVFGEREITVITSRSPSDPRAIQNWKSWLKRKLKDGN